MKRMPVAPVKPQSHQPVENTHDGYDYNAGTGEEKPSAGLLVESVCGGNIRIRQMTAAVNSCQKTETNPEAIRGYICR